MTVTLKSSLSNFQPLSFAKTAHGEVLMVNGMDQPLRWDGLMTTTELAGMPAGTTLPTVSAAGAGGGASTGDYTCRYRYIDREGIPGNLSDARTVSATALNTFNWSATTSSSDTRVVSTELWRSLVGQTGTLYLVTTVANGGTYATDTLTDAALANNESLAILLTDGSINAQRFGRPQSHMAYIVRHQARMFGCGIVDYDEGHIEVTNASGTVTGIGTAWTSEFVGRFLYIRGEDEPYEIVTVNVSAQTMTIRRLDLTASYNGTTDLFAVYAIRPAPAYRHAIYWTPAGEPESWNPLDSVTLPDVGGDETGMMVLGAFIFILKERSIRRYTYHNDPSPTTGDGESFEAARRGCENNRLCVQADGVAYLLDREGVYRFDGGSVQDVSEQIRDKFRPGGMNWAASKGWHAEYLSSEGIVRFWVNLSGSSLPKDCMTYNTRLGGWWVETRDHGLGASVQCPVVGQNRLLAGGEAFKVLLLQEGQLDVTNGAGTVLAAVDSATMCGLTDNDATFPTDCVGAPVSITRGLGKGQTRRIVAYSSGTLTIDRPWLVKPDSTSYYQVGGQAWNYKSGVFTFPMKEASTLRENRLLFQPTVAPMTLDIRTYMNRSSTPVNQGATTDQKSNAITTTKDKPDVVVDLTNAEGFARHQFDDKFEHRSRANRYMAVELRGVTGQEAVQVFELGMLGVAQ